MAQRLYQKLYFKIASVYQNLGNKETLDNIFNQH